MKSGYFCSIFSEWHPASVKAKHVKSVKAHSRPVRRLFKSVMDACSLPECDLQMRSGRSPCSLLNKAMCFCLLAFRCLRWGYCLNPPVLSRNGMRVQRSSAWSPLEGSQRDILFIQRSRGAGLIIISHYCNQCIAVTSGQRGPACLALDNDALWVKCLLVHR